MSAVELAATGATFVAAVLIGIGAGIGVGRASAQPAWVLLGLVLGVACGAYLAFRRFARFMR